MPAARRLAAGLLLTLTAAAVSAVGLGTWQLGADWGDVSEADARAVLEASVDAGVTFLKGLSLEGMGRRQEAAGQYQSYLKRTQKGKAAEHAYSRLQSWGYLK